MSPSAALAALASMPASVIAFPERASLVLWPASRGGVIAHAPMAEVTEFILMGALASIIARAIAGVVSLAQLRPFLSLHDRDRSSRICRGRRDACIAASALSATAATSLLAATSSTSEGCLCTISVGYIDRVVSRGKVPVRS